MCHRSRYGAEKYLLYVLSSFSRGLKEEQVMLLSERSTLLLANLPLALEIALVTDEHDNNVAVAVLPAVLKP